MQKLTNTEIRVVHFISQGYGFKEIANMMFLSVHTVNTHATNIRKKWNARNIADMTRMYILSLEDPKIVLRAMLCLVLQIGVVVFDSSPELRRTQQVRFSRRISKTQNQTYYV